MRHVQYLRRYYCQRQLLVTALQTLTSPHNSPSFRQARTLGPPRPPK